MIIIISLAKPARVAGPVISIEPERDPNALLMFVDPNQSQLKVKVGEKQEC